MHLSLIPFDQFLSLFYMVSFIIHQHQAVRLFPEGVDDSLYQDLLPLIPRRISLTGIDTHHKLLFPVQRAVFIGPAHLFSKLRLEKLLQTGYLDHRQILSSHMTGLYHLFQ